MDVLRLFLLFCIISAASIASPTKVHQHNTALETQASSGLPAYVFRALSGEDFRRYSEKKSLVPAACNPENHFAKSLELRHGCHNGGDCCLCHLSDHSSGFSSFISTTKDLDVAEFYNKDKRLGIVKVDLSKIPAGTVIIDMTEEKTRATHLYPTNGHHWRHLSSSHEQCWLEAVRHVSLSDKEVLIKGEIPREAYEYL
jgi:hypothetical protein